MKKKRKIPHGIDPKVVAVAEIQVVRAERQTCLVQSQHGQGDGAPVPGGHADLPGQKGSRLVFELHGAAPDLIRQHQLGEQLRDGSGLELGIPVWHRAALAVDAAVAPCPGLITHPHACCQT